MNSAKKVDEMILQWMEEQKPKDVIVWETAKACLDWPYVFGAWGAYCTPAERRKRYKPSHPTIKSKCKGFNSGDCRGCKWFPEEERVRCFDCRGFTDWCLLRVGVDLVGEGATSQWNNKQNWEAKGTIDTMPKDKLCCLFQKNGSKMSHTGFGYNNETMECQVGVEYHTPINKKWTHWAVPAGLYEDPLPDVKPTLRKGDSGPYVKYAQELLITKGYSLDPYGADGKFGNVTLKATKAFQKANSLVVDGIIGPRTWEKLEA